MIRFATKARVLVAIVPAIAMLSAFFVPRPASAVPGQTYGQFQQWSAGKTVLSGLAKSTEEMSGRPMWSVTNSDHGVTWSFYARSAAGQAIRGEMLAVASPPDGDEPGKTPIRHDGKGYGFTFFKALYGPGIASDFLRSKPTKIQGFYRGTRFGYIVANGTVTLETQAQFAVELDEAIKCQATPNACSE